MDDFGDDYQTEAWFYACTEWGHSMAAFGMLDDAAMDICTLHGADYAAQVI